MQEDGERGSVVVIVATIMLALLGVAALVVDLGYTRSDRHEARVAADDAATSGANKLTATTGGAGACADSDVVRVPGSAERRSRPPGPSPDRAPCWPAPALLPPPGPRCCRWARRR